MALEGNAIRYSTGAIVLHWLIALLLAGELALGFTMPRDASGFELYQLHKSIGIAILLLSLGRLGWRLTHPRPMASEGGIAGVLAKSVHALFYAFMILMPLTGWAIVSSASLDVPTMLFGVIPWPHLPISESMNGTFSEAHELIAFGGIGLFVLHVAGALRHHFMMHDGLLGRMAPGGKPATALALAAAVLLLGGGVYAAIGPRAEEEHDHATDHGPGNEDHPHADGDTAPGGDDAMAAGDEEHDHSTHDHGEEGEEESADEADAPEAEETAAAATPAGPPPKWTIQPGGSLRFTAQNAGSAINGSFSSWSGNIAFDPENPETANIAITVQLGSASLSDATQEGMLKGADFFSVSSFPSATWRSTSVTALGGNRYRANGTLSLKGASKPQTVNFTLAGTGNRRSVTGSATIDRNAFGVGTGESAAGVAGNVALNFTFDATR